MGVNAAKVTVSGDRTAEFEMKLGLHPIAARGIEYAIRMEGNVATIGMGGWALAKGGVLARCLVNSGGNYLEIGSQYGLSAIVASHFCEGHAYCIDPMDKVVEDESTKYGPAYAPIEGRTGHMGERVLFERNIRFFGLEDKVTLVQEFSDPYPISPQVFFGTAYIDGDHSYAMVKRDFFNIMNQVTHYIILDDFCKEPGVDQALPEILAEQDQFKLILAVQKIAVLARPDVKKEVGLW